MSYRSRHAWRTWGTSSEVQYDNGMEGAIEKQYDGRATAYDWWLSCSNENVDQGSEFTLTAAKEACDKAMAAHSAACEVSR